MTLPNLVIAGAPKCGTSSMFNWLVDHPEVCGSSVKEAFFLMDQDHPLRRRECNIQDHGLDAYSSLFCDCGPEHKIVVEATTHYMYQTTALDVLASLPTRPRVAFLVRKPSERVYSSFAYSKNNLGNVRQRLSFSEFVRLLRDGADEAIYERVFGSSAYVLARDLHYSRYSNYLSLWRERLGPDRMRVLLFEDLAAGPRAVMEEFCKWLGIDPAIYADYEFAARNRTVEVRSGHLQRFARRAANVAPAGRAKSMLKKLYAAVQSRPSSTRRSSEDEAALAELDEEFRPFNERLATEFHLDLGAWK